ncbi:MAG TPA: hypothetical protein VIK89_00280 [Cytophagaceae bacterium]
MNLNKNDLFFFVSLILALWFALTAGAWFFWLNLFVSFPAGILSFILYKQGIKDDTRKNRYKIIKVIWVIGIIVSLGMLVYILLSK